MILALAGIGLVAATIASEADTSVNLFAIPAIGFFIGLAAAPYALLGAVSRTLVKAGPLALCAIALVALSVFWTWAFGAVFWWNDTPDAQDGLALLVFPALMIAASGPVALVAWLLERFL
jgi:hypothetical protein